VIHQQEETMELQAARQIIDTLAQGVHPVTGEVMPEDSPYNAPPVIRALFAVSNALDGASPTVAPKPRRELPPNAGKAWLPEEDGKLESAFAAGIDIKQIAQELGRTEFAVESRLVKMGKLPPRPGMRVAASAG
jgi:DNA-binding NarL/FixJ family response regulator